MIAEPAMRPLASHVFTDAEQEAFAALSGDWNPIHTDAVAARRTVFGAPIVHGIHGVLWALAALGQRGGLRTIEAKFLHAITPGTPVECHVTDDSPDSFALVLRQSGVRSLIVRGAFGPATAVYAIPRVRHKSRIPARVRLDQAAAMSGRVPLTFDPSAADAILPGIVHALPPWQVAALLATTRIVGVECPGLQSLYSSLALDFDVPDMPGQDPEMSYAVTSVDDRFSLIEIEVRCPGARGALRAFVRPTSPAQPTIAEAAALVNAHEFRDWRALVVGGSRGLGEVAAKLVAAGGGTVCLTFHRGRADGQAVCDEVRGSGADATLIQLDVTDDHFPALPWAAPTHLLYFATPHIGSRATATFSGEQFEEFCRFYVTGFERTLAAFKPSEAVLYPSTVFLDEITAGMAEYCAAKAAGEELCRHLATAAGGCRIHTPRLPRILTDQTAGFMTTDMADPLRTILRELRAL